MSRTNALGGGAVGQERLRVTAWTDLGPLGRAGPNRMNNETTESVSSKIDEKLTEAGTLDLQGIQTWMAENAPKLGNHPIAGHVGMLGTFGYNRDKASTGAASRISDLGHANLGLRADVFVTDDRRLRNRARATAHELELCGVVADEAVQAIAEVVEYGRR